MTYKEIVAALRPGLYSDDKEWRVIAPLKAAGVLESCGHLIAVAWAIATEIRAGQIAAADARMIAAGCLICPSCGADGSAGDSSTPAFYYVETMDSRRSCGVKLRRIGSERTVVVSDVYQDDYEGGRDERVCCEACGWEFELPEGVSFEHGVSGGVIDREVDAHLGVTTKPARTKRGKPVRAKDPSDCSYCVAKARGQNPAAFLHSADCPVRLANKRVSKRGA